MSAVFDRSGRGRGLFVQFCRMFSLKTLADNTRSDSLANRLRRKRFAYFRALLAAVPRPLRILDVGGAQDFWLKMGFGDEQGVTIVITNISDAPLTLIPHDGATKFESVWADGRDLSQFNDGEFDVVFSNSVIEHVGELADQEAMMKEVMRVGKRYWVQTPNYWFPVEPHFHFIGFQFLPISARAWLLHHFSLGWAPKQSSIEQGRLVAKQTRLMTRQEIARTDPEASFYNEKFLGLVKSFSMFKGWDVGRV